MKQINITRRYYIRFGRIYYSRFGIMLYKSSGVLDINFHYFRFSFYFPGDIK